MDYGEAGDGCLSRRLQMSNCPITIWREGPLLGGMCQVRYFLYARREGETDVADSKPIWAPDDDPDLLLDGLGRLIGIRGPFQRVESGLRLFQDIAVRVFPGAQEQKRQGSRQGPELGIARNPSLRLPAKELCCNEKGENGPSSEGQNLHQELRNGK